MKTIIVSLIGLVVIWAWALCSHAQTVEVFNAFGPVSDKDWKNQAKQIFVCAPPWGRWLTIGRINTTDPDQKGFEPNMTYLICKFKPVVKQLANGYYEVTFTSEFTKNLP